MGRGGVEIQLRDRAQELVRRGHSVAVVSMMPFLDFEAQLRDAGVTTLSLDMVGRRSAPGAALKCASFLKLFRPDVVHSHLFVATMFARTLRALPTGLRGNWSALVCSSHCRREENVLRYAAYRATSGLGTVWTSVSREGIAVHEKWHSFPRGTALWTPNGVDLATYHPDASCRRACRDKLGIGDAFVWLAVGSLRDESKDYTNLLRAFAGVPSAILLIAGDGILRTAKEAVARELDIAHRVRFLGLCTNVDSLMQAADGYVLSSRTEAMPNVLLQAAATQLPIVTTDVGEAAEIIEDGVGGLVVAPEDPVALRRALLTIQESGPEPRGAMGRAARARVADLFELGRVVDRWERLYSSLQSSR